MLTLPIKKQWYDMILSGKKKEEYRALRPYYTTRFMNVWGFPAYWSEPHRVRFRNGYRSDSPSFTAVCTLCIRYGRPEWGAVEGIMCYVLKIISIDKEEQTE